MNSNRSQSRIAISKAHCGMPTNHLERRDLISSALRLARVRLLALDKIVWSYWTSKQLLYVATLPKSRGVLLVRGLRPHADRFKFRAIEDSPMKNRSKIWTPNKALWIVMYLFSLTFIRFAALQMSHRAFISYCRKQTLKSRTLSGCKISIQWCSSQQFGERSVGLIWSHYEFVNVCQVANRVFVDPKWIRKGEPKDSERVEKNLKFRSWTRLFCTIESMPSRVRRPKWQNRRL